MRNLLSKFFLVLGVLALAGLPVFGQATATGSLTGTITDPTGAVVPGASVVVTNAGTGQQFNAKTNDEGIFTIPTLTSGLYTAAISVKGFKQAKVTDIKILAGTPASFNVVLEVGSQDQTVTIVGSAELLQTQTATVGTTLTGRQITDIPTASRDALDLVLALPGTTTPGRPRTSTVNGLPKGALNITLDGINVQDNTLKSSDGFFTYVRPRTDAIAEVTVSTSNPGAESSAEGAVQIKFVTQGGTNEYHGGGYWYHRNPALNANYWFNNRDLAADPVTHKAPQQRIILNQFGVKVGGPISLPKLWSGKDRAFFFVNYEEYRLPEKSVQRVRTIYTQDAANGIYKFNTTNATYAGAPPAGITCGAAVSGTFTCSGNVLTFAAAAGLISTVDPTIKSLLGEIRSSVATVSGVLNPLASNPNLEQFGFFNVGGQTRRFPTVRLDANLGKNHHLENISNYQQFGSVVDFLNGVDPVFPGFPNHGSQTSNRFSNTSAWRWTITPSIVNEARFGLTGGTTKFFGEVTPGQFANQGLVAQNINSPGFGVTNPTATTGPELRNAPVKQFNDNVSWVHGNHAFNFGGSYTRLNLWITDATVVPTVNYGVSSTLESTAPAFTAFANFAPTVSQQGNAANLYALLSGRISSLTRYVGLSETTAKYTPQGFFTSRAQQSEYGLYVQDTWRFRPNVTLTGGIRWEVQGPFQSLNDTLTQVGYAGLFGESGVNNLFKPGTLTGSPSQYTRFAAGDKTHNTDYGNFAPSFGFTWSPNFKSGLLHKLAGESGQTVLRGGFSMAFVREGLNSFLSIIAGNPGQTISANQNITGTPFPLTFGNYFRNGLPALDPKVPTAPVLPNFGTITDGVNAFDPNLKTGYVESWTAGIQREIKKDNVVELRYVGNRGHQLWRQVDLNETNVFENGFINEFRLAQQNALANIAAGRFGCAVNQNPCVAANRTITFAYFGPGTGTSPLPIILGHFTGVGTAGAGTANNYQPFTGAVVVGSPATAPGSLFANTTLSALLNPLNPSVGAGRCCGGFAGQLASTGNESLFANNRILAGIPINEWVVNPGKRGGSFIINNGNQTWYDAVTLEFRRRLSRGLLVQSNYTFGKSLSNSYASSSFVFDQPATLRDYHLRKDVSPFDITQAFKTNFIYELPFGHGKQFLGNTKGIVNGFLGNWTFNGNIRIQSGSALNFGNVQLVGMSRKDLQKAIGIYRGQPNSDNSNNTRGDVWFLPLDIRLNTFRANNVAFNWASGGAVYTQGAPSGRFIAPAGFNNCQQGIVGQCGFNNLVIKGPSFFRFDLSLAKKIKFTERMNLEMRAEALNAFNNINWLVGSAGNDVNTVGGTGTGTFGRFTAAYQDISTTNDPGGRLVQLVLRLNF